MTKLDTSLWPSINGLSGPLVQQLIDNARALQIGVSTHESGATVVDAGILHAGSAEAGRLIAEICMGGLVKVELSDKTAFKQWPSGIKVQSKSPVLACLGSQYAGWALSNESGHEKMCIRDRYGIKPAVVAIVLFAAYRIGLRTLKNGALWSIAAASFVAIAILKVPFPLIVLSAAIIGYIMNRFWPVLLASGGGHLASQKSYGKAVIDDDTPTPSHARFSVKGFVKILVVGIAIWLAGMLLLILRYGWDATLTQMAWFFTKAALLTFGGAYAVLPYVCLLYTSRCV